MFPIWSKLPSSFLFQCWYQAGTWFPPGVCCTFLERGEKKKKSITAVWGENAVKLWLSPRCAELVSFNSFSSLWSCVGGFPGPIYPRLLLPSSVLYTSPLPGVRSKAQTGPAFASKSSKGSFDPPWPVAFAAHLRLLQEQSASPLFLPPLGLALLSLPPSLFWFFAPSLLASLLSFCLNWRGSGKLTRLEGGACWLLGRPEVGRKWAGWRMGLRGGKEGSLPRMETWGMLSLSVALGSHVMIPDVSPRLSGLLPLSLVLQG